LIIIYHFDER